MIEKDADQASEPLRGTAVVIVPTTVLPPGIFTPTPKAAKRVLEFFTAQINNDHTRKSYHNATRRFAAWCKKNGIHELVDVEPFHVAKFIKELQDSFSPPTVKQHLAALRMPVRLACYWPCHRDEPGPRGPGSEIRGEAREDTGAGKRRSPAAAGLDRRQHAQGPS